MIKDNDSHKNNRPIRRTGKVIVMNENRMRVALSCFAGAVIGALLALHFNRYFCWLGIITGGLIGYLSYEFKTVCRKFVHSWNEACTIYGYCFQWIWVKELSRKMLNALSCGLSFMCSTVLFLLSGISWVALLFASDQAFLFKGNILIISIAVSIPSLFLSAGCLSIYELISEKASLSSKQGVFRMFLYTNPISVIFWWLPKGVFMGLYWIAKRIPFAAIFLWQVIKRTFVLIHSEIRLLCMTDAMIGSLIGFACGNALIGGIAGAVCGVLNYEIISVWWLKLVDA